MSINTTENPWGLTERQVNTLRATISLGSRKQAARVMGLSTHTVADHLRDAKRKIGRGSRSYYLIAFDRWDRKE